MRSNQQTAWNWSNIPHEKNHIRNTIIPELSILTLAQKKICHDFFLKHLRSKGAPGSADVEEAVKSSLNNAFNLKRQNDQPWHAIDGSSYNNVKLFHKYPERILDQLQWWQPCFNPSTMPDFGYKTFFPNNQISFTGFFIKTIKHFAEKHRNQLTENSLTDTKARFKDDPIIQFFCNFLVSKKQFKRMFLLRQGDDYTTLNEPHVLAFFRYIVSNLVDNNPQSENTQASLLDSYKSNYSRKFELITNTNLPAIHQSLCDILDTTKTLFQLKHQETVEKYNDMRLCLKKSIEAKDVQMQHMSFQQHLDDERKSSAIQSWQSSYRKCRAYVQTHALFNVLKKRIENADLNTRRKINQELASLNLLDCSQHLEFVLREGITVVAMALLTLKVDSQSISLNFFCVHPEFQRQGIGKDFLNRLSSLFALFFDNGTVSLNIPCPLRLAHQFYHQQGFVNQTSNNSVYSDEEQSEYDTDDLSDYDCETEDDFFNTQSKYGQKADAMQKTITVRSSRHEGGTLTGNNRSEDNNNSSLRTNKRNTSSRESYNPLDLSFMSQYDTKGSYYAQGSNNNSRKPRKRQRLQQQETSASSNDSVSIS